MLNANQRPHRLEHTSPPLLTAAVLAAVIAPSSARAARLTLDLGAPIDSSGNISPIITSGVAAQVGADCVRLNFILGPWNSPEDAGWRQTYDQIVDTLVGEGLEVYSLIGAEAVHSSAGSVNSDQFVSDYTYNFVSIVDHFKDRIRVYESFNEPNNWAAGTSEPTLSAYYFAYALQEIYLNTKYFNGHEGDAAWQVTLVSGPLFSHDQDTGASYLTDTYNNGRSNLAWDWCRTTYGTYPLDGVGYHLYVAQGTTSSSAVTSGLDTNLDAIWGALTAQEGAGTPKRLWVSELGWSSDAVGEQGQASNLTTGMTHLLGDSRIELATWFTTQDWSGNAWGLFRSSGLSTADQKPSYSAYYDLAQGSGDGGDDGTGCGALAGVRIGGRPVGGRQLGASSPLLLVGLGIGGLVRRARRQEG